MRNSVALFLTILGAVAAPVFGQNQQRRATITGNNGSGQASCTIEVLVDGAVEVELRGDAGTLRNISGQTPQWRRFECTERMPFNPASFEFRGVPGRGEMALTSDPSNSGVAVIRIEDRSSGAQNYSFGVFWNGSSAISGNSNGSIFGDEGNFPNNNRRGNRGRLTQDEAVQLCQDSVRQRATERWGSADLTFHSANMNDNNGARDRVTGTVSSSNSRRGWQNSSYSCDVNTNNGRILAVQVDDRVNNRGNRGNNGNTQIYGDRSGQAITNTTQAMRSCESAVRDRVRNEGYSTVRFGTTNVRNNRIIGSARADRANGADSFDFACDVYNGAVQVSELNRR